MNYIFSLHTGMTLFLSLEPALKTLVQAFVRVRNFYARGQEARNGEMRMPIAWDAEFQIEKKHAFVNARHVDV